MEQNAYMAWMLDFYGAMLTPRQRFILSQHVNEDFSLSEIAEMEGISRQGVYDTVHKAQAQLIGFEEKLGLLKRYLNLRKAIERAADSIEEGDTVSAHQYLMSALEGEEA